MSEEQSLAEAQETGDTGKANELYRQQLEMLEAQESEADDQSGDFGPPKPVPVELNDEVYQGFREQFGEDEAARLQNALGDHAFEHANVTAALIEDHPEIGRVYEQHQTEDGSLSIHGVQAGMNYLMKTAGYESPEALETAHPELAALWHEHADDNGNLSPVGFQRMLSYLAKRSGYKYTHRGRRT